MTRHIMLMDSDLLTETGDLTDLSFSFLRVYEAAVLAGWVDADADSGPVVHFQYSCLQGSSPMRPEQWIAEFPDVAVSFFEELVNLESAHA